MTPLPRFEINVVDHCNMRCRGCNHMSPIMPAGFVRPAELAEDLGFLATMIHAEKVRLVGGEPLLHPQIDLVVETVRASGIGDEVEVATNGKLLAGMTPVFWGMTDRVHVSLYPGTKADWPKECEDKVRVDKIATFQESFSTVRNGDEDLVRRIWDKCGIRNVYFGLANRHFYKCMRAPFIGRVAGIQPKLDGIALVGLTERDLVARIRDTAPLEACRFCTGTMGARFGHEELLAENWMVPHARPVPALLRT